MSYNSRARRLPLRLTKHAKQRMLWYGLQHAAVDKAVRHGKLLPGRKAAAGRLCTAHYDGKTNQTTIVVACATAKYVKVITLWQKKGR